MKTTKHSPILNLWLGNNQTQETTPPSTGEKKVLSKLELKDKELREILSSVNPATIDLYSSITELFDSFSVESANNSFVVGFRQGFKLALDVFEI